LGKKAPNFSSVTDEFIPWNTQYNNDCKPVNVRCYIDCNTQIREGVEIKQMNRDKIPKCIKIFEVKYSAAKDD
jgi:hypothetical protein